MAKKTRTSTTAGGEEPPANSVQALLLPVKQFGLDSMRLLTRCTKPDAKEFKKIALATSIGFLVMGFLGFIVKLVHIPSTQTHTQRMTPCSAGDGLHGPQHAASDCPLPLLLSSSAAAVNNIIVGS